MTRIPTGDWYAWVDPFVKHRLLHDPQSLSGPVEQHVSAAVALLDIAGFTALTEDLAREGPIGAERLKHVLDRCFGVLLDQVYEHGGEVLTFPGDGVLAVWTVGPTRDLTDAVRHAALCCRAAIAQMAADRGSEHGTALELKAVVAAGRIRAWRVGGVGDRWASLVGGAPFRELARAASHARSGDVIVTSEAWHRLASHASASSVDGTCYRLERIEPVASRSHADPGPDTGTSPLGDPAFRAAIPDAVLAHLDAGNAEWLAGFRPVTAMFISLAGLDAEADEGLGMLNRAVACVQGATAQYDGALNQALVDDKGTILLLGWGLALHAHEDNAARAVEAALEMRLGLSDLGCGSAIGIATGRVFTGIRGNARRKEYAMIGDVVNVAARLMQGVSDGIWCDDRTRSEARRRILFERLSSVRVRGRTEPITVYRPLKKRVAASGDDIVDRRVERSFLLSRLRALESGESTGTIVVEGEPGIGKSRAIASVLRYTQTSSVRSVIATGDPIQRSSSYHAWRDALPRLLGLDDESTIERRRQRVLTLLDDPELVRQAPILNDVLRLGLAETEETGRMTPQGRAEALRELLLHLFQRATGQLPTLVVLEDAHWFDSASWALADALARRVRSLMPLACMRPVPSHELTPDAQRFLGRADVTRLSLETLGPEDATVLASQCLGADELPQELSNLMWQRAAGHPFYIEHLALSLKENGVVRVHQGTCELTADSETLASLKIPETVQGVVTARIDRLSPSQQALLRVASVIGAEFDLESVVAVLSSGVTSADVQSDLNAMVDLGLLVAISGTRPTYGFKHAITRQVAYDLLPYAERRELHRLVADRMERADGVRNNAVLAHHWTEAGVLLKAFEYLVVAGEDAARADANPEAAGFFTQALAVELAGTGLTDIEIAVRRARCFRRRGEVLFWLGELEQVPADIQSVFGLLPRSRRWHEGRLGLLVSQTLAQASHLLVPRLLQARGEMERHLLLEGSKAASLLALVRSTPPDAVGLLGASLLSQNLAERGGSANVFGLGILGYVAAGLGLRGLSGRYFDRARAKAFELNELADYELALLFDGMARFGAGDHASAVQVVTEGLHLARRIGDRRALARTSTMLAALNGFTLTVCVPEVLRQATEALEVVKDQPALDRAYFVGNLAATIAMFLRPADATSAIAALAADIDDALARGSPDATALLFATRALLQRRCGNLEGARDAADKAMAWLRRNWRAMQSPGWATLTGPLETYFALCRHEAGQGYLGPGTARQFREVVGILRRFARAHPIFAARARYFEAHLAALQGRHPDALEKWRLAVTIAERLRLPLDQAMARLQLAHSAPPAERGQHLARVSELLRRSEAPYFLDLLAAIENSESSVGI